MAENKAYEPDEAGGLPLSTMPKEKLHVQEGLPEPSQSFTQVAKSFPKSIFFIVGNEFCERFSYYGFRTVLTLYFINVIGLSNDNAVAGFHAFTVVAYFTPILGSVLADGYIGKFHTILWVSLLYASGNVILAISATYPKGGKVHPAMDIVGLLVIAIGTGGIKPCVSAFGGDQFQKGQEKALELFFSVFYFSINAGSTISVLVTPILREKSCTVAGRYLDSCFALCFGIPAILMVCACLFFIFGSFWYKRYPPKENIFVEVFRVISAALVNRSRFSIPREHWLDHYLDDHSCQWDHRCTEKKCQKIQFVQDIKAVMRIMVLYLPVPFFWALYDQQGSQWLIQGTQMDGKAGKIQILPDSLQVANPILIMIFIPIFSGIVYPLSAKFVKVTPLRKMTGGGVLAVVAYVLTAIIQLRVNPTLPVIPEKGQFSIRFMNLQACPVIATMHDEKGNPLDGVSVHLPAYEANVTNNEDYYKIGLPAGKYSVHFTSPNSTKCTKTFNMTEFASEKAYYAVASPDFHTVALSDLQKPENGFGEYEMSFNMFIPGFQAGSPIVLCSPPKHKTVNDCFTHDVQKKEDRYINGTFESGGVANWGGEDNPTFVTVRPFDNWHLFLPKSGAVTAQNETSDFYAFGIDSQGAIYTFTIYGNESSTFNDWSHEQTELVSPNTVPILLQLPQFIVITAAEILFSITGLELSYSQSPASMKSLLQGIWLLCVAVGDCIILIIVEAGSTGGGSGGLSNKAYEFFLFAGIMLVVIIIFALIAQFRYTYVYYIHEEGEEAEEKEEKKESP